MYSKEIDDNKGPCFGSKDSDTYWALGIGENFGVTMDGNLYAQNANITGRITATEGELRNLTLEGSITSNYLKLTASPNVSGYFFEVGKTMDTKATIAINPVVPYTKRTSMGVTTYTATYSAPPGWTIKNGLYSDWSISIVPDGNMITFSTSNISAMQFENVITPKITLSPKQSREPSLRINESGSIIVPVWNSSTNSFVDTDLLLWIQNLETKISNLSSGTSEI